MDIPQNKLIAAVVQSLSPVGLFATPWTQHASLPCPSPSPSLFKLTSIESVMPSNHLILCCAFLPVNSIFPSITVFSNESVLCIRWPKYRNFRFSISPSNEYSGLISFRIDWFDFLAVQGTLKSCPQHCRSKSSILSCQPSLWSNSHIYRWLPEKNIALTICTFVGKVMSYFLILSRFVIAFLPNFMATVTIHSGFGAQENKVCYCFHFPIYLHLKWWDQMPWS